MAGNLKPLYSYQPKFQDSENWEICKDKNDIFPSGLKYDEVIIEGQLCDKTFEGIDKPFPGDFAHLRPDLLINQKHSKRIIIIENKTVGASLLVRQLENYIGVIKFLSENGFKASLLFCVSRGWGSNSEWRLLSDKNKEKPNTFRILLWEDVLQNIASAKLNFGQIFPNLLEYYQYSENDLHKGKLIS